MIDLDVQHTEKTAITGPANAQINPFSMDNQHLHFLQVQFKIFIVCLGTYRSSLTDPNTAVITTIGSGNAVTIHHIMKPTHELPLLTPTQKHEEIPLVSSFTKHFDHQQIQHDALN